jgi:hypothetical protein
VPGDPGQHARADLVAIVEGEDEIRPVGMGENPVGAAGVSLDAPANSEKCYQDLAGFP